MQAAHAIGLSLYAYANDYHGLYPDGTSSTEVFQKLLDGGYVTDPEFFYVPMDGKTKPSQDQKKLKPENVSWDVTGGLGLNDTGRLPLVFLTGFRISYVPGGGAEPIIKPYPPYTYFKSGSGLAAYFTDNSAAWVVSPTPAENYNSHYPTMEHLIAPDFDTHGKTYRQLTPEGVLR